jgi:predicted outer membrane repeat protein
MYAWTMFRMIFVVTAACLAALALALLGGARPGLADDVVITDDAIIYVDADASPGGDGQSWSTAYRTLQDALDKANGSENYEIWVAEGVYYPDEDGDGDHVGDAVTETFRIDHNTVQLYGGFAGGETSRDQRDWEANVTVLSGDIDGNDLTDARGVVITTTHISGDNAYHVLWLDGETNEPITGRTVIDGFTITAGQADGSWADDDGGGLFCAGSGRGNVGEDAQCSPALTHVVFTGNFAEADGGAMVNDGSDGISSPTLTNVTFDGNSAGSRGGGIYNDGGDGGASSPTLTHVTFSGNTAYWGGGAMYNDARHGASSPTLTHVTFSSNAARRGGGAMYNNGVHGGASSPALTHVTFHGNSAGSRGGGMYNSADDGVSSPTLTHVTFSGNSAETDGGAIYSEGCLSGVGSPTLMNVTFDGNSAGWRGGAMVNNGQDGGASSPTLTNVTFSGNSAEDDGGAMVNDGGDGGVSSPTLTNVTFSGNSAEADGGAMVNDGMGESAGTCSPTLTNIILSSNNATGHGDHMYNHRAAPAIGYSLVEDGWDGSGVYNDASTVTDNGGNIDADPQFVNAEDGDLHLQSISPAIDAGDNSALPSSVTTDLDGNPRFVDIPTVSDTGSGTPPIVDMGAYEVQTLRNRVYLPLILRNHQ